MKVANNLIRLRSSKAFIIGMVIVVLLCYSMHGSATLQESENGTTLQTDQEQGIHTEPTQVEETLDAEVIRQEDSTTAPDEEVVLEETGPIALQFKPIKPKRPELVTDKTESIEETTETTEEVKETEPQKVQSNTEFQDRCRITYAESGIESLEGQIAVAAVILNREQSSKFPNTFYGVINQSGQFSTVINGEIYNCGKPVRYENIPNKTIEAVERALNGEDPTEQLLWDEAIRLGFDPEKYAAGGACFFMTQNAFESYKSQISVYIVIGNHVFFKVWG